MDYVTCVCINDALPPDQKKFDCINDKVDLKYVPDSKTIDLFNELQKLKKQSNVGSDYSKFLTEEIFNDEKKLTKIYSFASSLKRKGAKMDKIKADIREYISSSRTSDNKESTSSELIKIKSDETDSNVNIGETDPYSDDIKQPNLNSENPTSSKFNIWVAILFVLTFTIAILLIRIYILLDKKIRNLSARIDKTIKKEQLLNTHSPHDTQNSKETLRILKLESTVKYLEHSISKLTFTSISKEEKSPELILEISKTHTPQRITFYMATPNKEDGSFDISGQTDMFKPTQSLYKFTVDESNKSKAIFVFDSDEIGISEAVNTPHRYLDGVCEIENARNPNAKKIVTTTPGTAEKRNDKWVVTIKAKIKYE